MASSSPPPLSPVSDVRHVSSNLDVQAVSSPRERDQHISASNRYSQHLRASPPHVGSKSPNSMPSSPTSLHSSSSAIFERDIEPVPCPSPPHPHHPPNPHRIPRSKMTESIEQSVPSVLDSAAAILASVSPLDYSTDSIAVVAPAKPSSGFASPIGSFRSRSPSPFGSPAHRASLLLGPVHPSPSIIANVSAARPISPLASSPPPIIVPQDSSSQTVPPVLLSLENQGSSPLQSTQLASHESGTPAIVTPGSAYFSISSTVPNSVEASPIATTREQLTQIATDTATSSSPPAHLTASPPHQTSPTSQHPAPSSFSRPLSHPPSPTSSISKRLSFMSYSDLLSSTPASTVPLSALTTSASTDEPPPHIPAVSTYTQQPHGPGAPSLRNFTAGSSASGNRDSLALLDDIGGEWEREGLGRGLEERLEALMPLQGDNS